MTRDETIERTLALIEEGWPGWVDTAVDAVWAEVPAYARATDPSMRRELGHHVAAVFRVIVVCLKEDRAATRADFPSTRQAAHDRVEQGVLLSDFLKAFRIGQMTIWQGILDIVKGDRVARDWALENVDKLMNVVEVGSTVAAEGYIEAQQHDVAAQDRRIRDLIDDLLRREEVTSVGKVAMLRAAGLDPEVPYVVLSAVPTEATADESRVSLIEATMKVAPSAYGGLAATRRDEVIGLIPATSPDGTAVIEFMEKANARLATTGVWLSVGLSTIRHRLDEVPEAYEEAAFARAATHGRHEVLGLSRLSAFDYLVLHADETAQRLVSPAMWTFVEQDLAGGGALVETLETYLDADLNAKVVAQRLHMHVNSVYYRLNKVAEQTGCDLRRTVDVRDLSIAIRLVREALRRERA